MLVVQRQTEKEKKFYNQYKIQWDSIRGEYCELKNKIRKHSDRLSNDRNISVVEKTKLIAAIEKYSEQAHQLREKTHKLRGTIREGEEEQQANTANNMPHNKVVKAFRQAVEWGNGSIHTLYSTPRIVLFQYNV